MSHNMNLIICLIVLIILLSFQVCAVKRHWKQSESNLNLKDNIELRVRVLAFYLFWRLGLWTALLIMLGLILFSFYSFVDAFSSYNSSSGDIFVEKIFTALEYLFLAPIPRVVVLSFETINNKEDENSITEKDARKMFVSSIIAVFATLMVKEFIVQFTYLDKEEGWFLHHPFAGIAEFGLLIIFVAVLIGFFLVLEKSKE